jgi:hypothetical protein
MIYELKENLKYDENHYKTCYFNKETVAISYVTLSSNSAKKECNMAIVAVARKNGEPIHTFSSKNYVGAEYDFICSLFDNKGNLTQEGYAFALDNFTIGEKPLKDIILGPVELTPAPIVVVEPEPVVEEPVVDPE